MKKKILFVSIIAALLMVSMPFVSTLQATYVQPQSTSVTKTTTTATNTVQTPTSTMPSITSVQQATVALIKIKMSTSDPEVQALASQGIALMQKSTSNVNTICVMLEIWMAGVITLLAIARAAYKGGNKAALPLVLAYEAILAGFLTIYKANDCSISDHNPTMSSTSTYMTLPSASGCSLCSQ